MRSKSEIPLRTTNETGDQEIQDLNAKPMSPFKLAKDFESCLVSSASSAGQPGNPLTPEIQDAIERCTKRSRSNLDGTSKYKCSITSERLAQLKKIVENATRDHHVFSIKGGWPVIRRELLKRNWIEKNEQANKHKFSNMEDVATNLPEKHDWESPTTYVEKCEKTIMSRMLQSYDVDIYWSMRKEPSDMQHRNNAFKLINRFSRSLFASKEGLALLLQQAYWFVEDGVSSVNFPRCYVLGFPDHYNLFVDDFRLTACSGLLKWFAEKYEKSEKYSIMSPEGKVPYASIQFAIDRINEFILSKKHIDIDKEFNRIWDHEWDQFLTHYYIILHDQGLFLDFKEPLTSVYASVRKTLKEFAKYWPQLDIDGMKNIWIMKPGNKCRGRGIQLIKTVADAEKVISLKLKYVVQKYIERPLIIHKTKFDIRQWFMVTNVQPLTIWMYRDSYLRFSGQVFSLEDFHESLHLTNHAVQCKYPNGEERDKCLPDDNMWDCHTFKNYLKKIGQFEKWNDVIYPGMRQSIVCAMLASQDTMDRRQNTFEIYGADFMLSEDFTPWLLEINCSPDLSFSTKVTSRLCPKCMEDIIKVVVDRRKDPNADTGLFEMIYKQNYPKTPPYLGMNLSVRGRKLFRNRSKSKTENKVESKEKSICKMKNRDVVKADFISDAAIRKTLPKILSPNIYKGPVIADLIEELSKSVQGDDCGVNFIPAVTTKPLKERNTTGKLKKSDSAKTERKVKRKKRRSFNN